jgi:3-hydroxymyristoyl/3-hydroxydecanoyl-(acyl carrier protein) dehydratase
MEVEMLSFKRSMIKIAGKAFVDGKMVAQGTFMAMVVDREK